MQVFNRILCFFGWHYGDLYLRGELLMKKCACGRYFYDASSKEYEGLIWIPCDALGNACE